MNYNLQLGNAYNFELLAPAILENGYKNAIVVAIFDFQTAIAFEDVVPKHAAAYPSLPAGTPINPRDLVYFKIKTSTGETRVLAFDWLANEPTLVRNIKAVVTIPNIDLSKLPVLRACLEQNGFIGFDITTT